MEFTLDIPLIRRILGEEEGAARDAIRHLGPLGALGESQRRHDIRLAAAPDANTLACRTGCAWCCYFTVDVRAAEVFQILDFVERAFTPEQIARVQVEVHSNSAEIQSLDEAARATRNIRCPFLLEGRCSIYAVRPQTCRNYHATNVAGCQQSYEEPDNSYIDPEFAPGVYQAGAAHVEAFSTSLSSAGFDADVYELNSALSAALLEPEARERFLSRLKPFTSLGGAAAPIEFDDLER